MSPGVRYDSTNDVVRIEISSDFHYDEGESENFLGSIRRALEGSRKHRLLCDVSKSSKLIPSKQMREWMSLKMKEIGFEKIAIVGITPFTRMIAGILAAALGKNQKTCFFSSPEEALLWLKG